MPAALYKCYRRDAGPAFHRRSVQAAIAQEMAADGEDPRDGLRHLVWDRDGIGAYGAWYADVGPDAFRAYWRFWTRQTPRWQAQALAEARAGGPSDLVGVLHLSPTRKRVGVWRWTRRRNHATPVYDTFEVDVTP